MVRIAVFVSGGGTNLQSLIDNLEKKVNAIPLPPNKHPKWITPSSKVTGTKNIKGDNNAK